MHLDFIAMLRTIVLMIFLCDLCVTQDAASLLTGLLSTFATSSRNPGCPGECRHVLSSLFCSHVQEDAECGDPQLRCCTNPPPTLQPPTTGQRPQNLPFASMDQYRNESTAKIPSDDGHAGEVDVIPSDRKRPMNDINGDGEHTFSRPPMLGQAVPISVVTNLTVRPGESGRPVRTTRRPSSRPVQRRRTTTSVISTTSTERNREGNSSTPAISVFIPTAAALSAPKPTSVRNKPCDGICVSTLVASFCSRISESSHCSPGETCCFTGGEEEEEEKENTRVAFTATTVSPTTHKMKTTAKSMAKTSIPPTQSTATSRPLSTGSSSRRPATTPVTKVPPRQPDHDEAVEECAGSCVMGLLSMLCDDIDDRISCKNGGKCCLSKSPEDTHTTDAPTVKPAIHKCPGICLPSLLSGVCNRPAILLPETLDCEAGSICCDNSLREAGQGSPITTTTTTTSPLLDMLSWPLMGALGAAAGLGGGSKPSHSENSENNALASTTSLLGQTLTELFGSSSGNDNEASPSSGPPFHAPQPISRPMQPTLVDRMQVDQDRLKCPGTCIPTFLKMTCFGSSQLVDMFSCPKENLLCCAPKSSFLGPPNRESTTPHWNNTFGRYPSSDATTLGFSQRPSVNKYVCGMKGAVRPETPRVVGGRDASPGEWCWQVALINSLNQYLCGGALIGRQWILTAAHCVTNLIRSGDAIYVRAGDYDLTSKYGSPGAQTLRVATTYIHHNHNSQTLDNNIALLKLEKQVELKEGICLVCLPARGVAVEAGKRCVVTGYGYMGESGPIPLRIREAVLPIVSEQDCVRKINSVTEKIFILPASSFCAGGEEGHDACQGDGGGPLSCEVEGAYELTGIVSWGFGCGRADVPGIYVKVSSFIGWINQIISVNSI